MVQKAEEKKRGRQREWETFRGFASCSDICMYKQLKSTAIQLAISYFLCASNFFPSPRWASLFTGEWSLFFFFSQSVHIFLLHMQTCLTQCVSMACVLGFASWPQLARSTLFRLEVSLPLTSQVTRPLLVSFSFLSFFSCLCLSKLKVNGGQRKVNGE